VAELDRFPGLNSPATFPPTMPAVPAMSPATPWTSVSAVGSSGNPSPSMSTLRKGRVTSPAALAAPVVIDPSLESGVFAKPGAVQGVAG
jgi:hypothetical protein